MINAKSEITGRSGHRTPQPCPRTAQWKPHLQQVAVVCPESLEKVQEGGAGVAVPAGGSQVCWRARSRFGAAGAGAGVAVARLPPGAAQPHVGTSAVCHNAAQPARSPSCRGLPRGPAPGHTGHQTGLIAL